MNCAGLKPVGVQDIIKVFEEPKIHSPDIYVIACQEIVELNPKNILIKDTKRVDFWRGILRETLKAVNSKR